MKQIFFAVALFALGAVAGSWWASSSDQTTSVPDNWLARIDNVYISEEEYVDAMRRRGGTRPGQYHEMAQKQELLEALLYRKAVTQAAREDGLDREPEIRNSLDRILVNQYIARHLRPRQEEVEISDEAVAEVYAQESERYAVPARRRVAMIQIEVPEGADDEFRERARGRAEEALAAARELDDETLHFGDLAREYSEDQSSRYRGGVIGWIGEQAPERYRHDPVVIETANEMQDAGAISGVLEGRDGYYIVRLVAYEPTRKRSIEELESGIRQRLRRDRYRAVEDEFRHEMLERFSIDVREERLAEIEPLGPPARDETRPPQGPGTDSRS